VSDAADGHGRDVDHACRADGCPAAAFEGGLFNGKGDFRSGKQAVPYLVVARTARRNQNVSPV